MISTKRKDELLGAYEAWYMGVEGVPEYLGEMLSGMNATDEEAAFIEQIERARFENPNGEKS